MQLGYPGKRGPLTAESVLYNQLSSFTAPLRETLLMTLSITYAI